MKLIKNKLSLCVVLSKFQDSFGAGYTFQETLPCTNKIVELKRFALCVIIRLNKPLTTYILSLTLNPNQAFHCLWFGGSHCDGCCSLLLSSSKLITALYKKLVKTQIDAKSAQETCAGCISRMTCLIALISFVTHSLICTAGSGALNCHDIQA